MNQMSHIESHSIYGGASDTELIIPKEEIRNFSKLLTVYFLLS